MTCIGRLLWNALLRRNGTHWLLQLIHTTSQNIDGVAQRH